MGLPLSRMNAVIQISGHFFKRRAEAALKGNSDFACLSNIGTTMRIGDPITFIKSIVSTGEQNKEMLTRMIPNFASITKIETKN